MGGGITLRKKTRLLQDELIWHLILLREVASSTSCDKILGIIAATFRYGNDVIDCSRIHPAPVTLSTIP
jgi:hypothetical protein